MENDNEKVRTIGSKELGQVDPEVAERVAERADRMARLKVMKRYWTYFSQIYSKIQNGMSLEEIQEEIKNKKSNMTSAARTFALTQEKYIKMWVQDLEAEKKETLENK